MEVLESFRQQYGDLHDALLWSMSYHYSRESTRPRLQMEVECQRITAEGPYVWQNIKLDFIGVTEFCFWEKLHTTQQVFFAVNYLADKDQCYFDFDYATDALEVAYMRKESSFHLTCREFAFTVLTTF